MVPRHMFYSLQCALIQKQHLTSLLSDPVMILSHYKIRKVVANFHTVYILFVTIEEKEAFKKENHCPPPEQHSGTMHWS